MPWYSFGCCFCFNLFNFLKQQHHNKKVWGEDADEFRPERFTKEECDKRDSFAFIPFSAGARNCIGFNFALQEEKIVLSQLIRKLDFVLDPTCKVEMEPQMVLIPMGLRMTFKPRSN